MKSDMWITSVTFLIFQQVALLLCNWIIFAFLRLLCIFNERRAYFVVDGVVVMLMPTLLYYMRLSLARCMYGDYI